MDEFEKDQNNSEVSNENEEINTAEILNEVEDFDISEVNELEDNEQNIESEVSEISEPNIIEQNIEQTVIKPVENNFNQVQNGPTIAKGFSEMPTGNNPPPKKKGGKGILWLIIVLLLAAAGYVYFSYGNIFASPKSKYVSLEKSSIKALSDEITGINEVLKPIKSNTSIKAELKGDIFESYSELVNNFEIVVSDTSDATNKKGVGSLKVNYDGDELAKLDYIVDGIKLYLGSDDFYDKYISVDTSDMKPIWDKFDTTGPDEIDIYQSQNEKNTGIAKHIVETYGNIFLNSIKKENVTIERNVDLTIENSEFKTEKCSVKFSKLEMLELAKTILQKLKTDDKTLNLIFPQYKQTKEAELRMMAMFGQDETDTKEITIDDLKVDIDFAIEELDGEILRAEIDNTLDFLIMNVFSDNKKIIKREIIIPGIETSFVFYACSDKTTNLVKAGFEVNYKEENYFTEEKEDKNMSIKFSQVEKTKEQEKYELILSMDKQEVKLNMVNDIENTVFKIEALFGANKLGTAEIDWDIKEDGKKTDYESVTDIDIDVLNAEIKLIVKGNSEEVNAVKIPTVKELNLNTASDEQMEKLLETLQENAMKYFENKAKIINKIMGAAAPVEQPIEE